MNQTASPPDIDAEWTLAGSLFAWPDYCALVGKVDKRLLAAAFISLGLGAAEITVKDGRWTRMFRGARAVIVPASVAGGNIIDLVAFRMDTPRSFWPLTGSAAVLGDDEIDRASAMGEPLQVHESPLDWLRAGRRGCVILDWVHCWPFYLGRVPALQFENREFAGRAAALMQRPLPVPSIFVRAA
jgi:hypothetical protein